MPTNNINPNNAKAQLAKNIEEAQKKLSPKDFQAYLKKVEATLQGTDKSLISQSAVTKLSDVSNTYINTDKYDKYGVDYNSDVDLQEQRARNQTTGEKWTRGLTNAGAELTLGTLKGLTSIPDVARNFGAVLTGGKATFENDISKALRETQESISEDNQVYKSEREGDFDLSSATWWTQNLPSIASSVTFIAPMFLTGRAASLATRGVQGLGGWVGKLAEARGLSKTASGLSKFASSERVAKGAGVLTGAVYSNAAESFQEAVPMALKAREEALAAGMSEEEANKLAAETGRSIYLRNTPNIALELFSSAAVLRNFKSSKEIFTTTAARAMAKELGLEMGTEGAQEIINYISSEEAQKNYKDKIAKFKEKSIKDKFLLPTEKNISLVEDELDSYINDGKMWTGFFFGAFGGGMFSAATGIKQRVDHKFSKDDISTFNRGKEKRILQKQRLAEIQALQNKETSFELAKDDILFEQVVSHAKAGTLGKLEEYLEALAEENPKEFGEDLSKVKQKIADMDDAYQESVSKLGYKIPEKNEGRDLNKEFAEAIYKRKSYRTALNEINRKLSEKQAEFEVLTALKSENVKNNLRLDSLNKELEDLYSQKERLEKRKQKIEAENKAIVNAKGFKKLEDTIDNIAIQIGNVENTKKELESIIQDKGKIIKDKDKDFVYQEWINEKESLKSEKNRIQNLIDLADKKYAELSDDKEREAFIQAEKTANNNLREKTANKVSKITSIDKLKELLEKAETGIEQEAIQERIKTLENNSKEEDIEEEIEEEIESEEESSNPFVKALRTNTKGKKKPTVTGDPTKDAEVPVDKKESNENNPKKPNPPQNEVTDKEFLEKEKIAKDLGFARYSDAINAVNKYLGKSYKKQDKEAFKSIPQNELEEAAEKRKSTKLPKKEKTPVETPTEETPKKKTREELQAEIQARQEELEKKLQAETEKLDNLNQALDNVKGTKEPSEKTDLEKQIEDLEKKKEETLKGAKEKANKAKRVLAKTKLIKSIETAKTIERLESIVDRAIENDLYDPDIQKLVQEKAASLQTEKELKNIEKNIDRRKLSDEDKETVKSATVKDGVVATDEEAEKILKTVNEKLSKIIKTIRSKIKSVVLGILLSAGLTGLYTSNLVTPQSVMGATSMVQYKLTQTGVLDESDRNLEVEIVDTTYKSPTLREEKRDSVPTFFQVVKRTKDFVSKYTPFSTAKDYIMSYRSQWNNSNGFIYIATPNKKGRGGSKLKKGESYTYNNVLGVGHFLIDSDIYGANASMNVDLTTNVEEYVPVFTKVDTVKNGTVVRLEYKKKKDVTEQDLKDKLIPNPLQQWKVSDIDWNTFHPYMKSGKQVKSKSGQDTGIMFTSGMENQFTRFSGNAVTFIFEDSTGNTVVRDFAGSFNDIKKEINIIKTEFNLKDSDITIGRYDAGSFSAKPQAREDGTISTDVWNYYNPEDGGAALLIPKDQSSFPAQQKSSSSGALALALLLGEALRKRRRKETLSPKEEEALKEFDSGNLITLLEKEIEDTIANIDRIEKEYTEIINDLKKQLDALPVKQELPEKDDLFYQFVGEDNTIYYKRTNEDGIDYYIDAKTQEIRELKDGDNPQPYGNTNALNEEEYTKEYLFTASKYNQVLISDKYGNIALYDEVMNSPDWRSRVRVVATKRFSNPNAKGKTLKERLQATLTEAATAFNKSWIKGNKKIFASSTIDVGFKLQGKNEAGVWEDIGEIKDPSEFIYAEDLNTEGEVVKFSEWTYEKFIEHFGKSFNEDTQFTEAEFNKLKSFQSDLLQLQEILKDKQYDADKNFDITDYLDLTPFVYSYQVLEDVETRPLLLDESIGIDKENIRIIDTLENSYVNSDKPVNEFPILGDIGKRYLAEVFFSNGLKGFIHVDPISSKENRESFVATLNSVRKKLLDVKPQDTDKGDITSGAIADDIVKEIKTYINPVTVNGVQYYFAIGSSFSSREKRYVPSIDIGNGDTKIKIELTKDLLDIEQLITIIQDRTKKPTLRKNNQREGGFGQEIILSENSFRKSIPLKGTNEVLKDFEVTVDTSAILTGLNFSINFAKVTEDFRTPENTLETDLESTKKEISPSKEKIQEEITKEISQMTSEEKLKEIENLEDLLIDATDPNDIETYENQIELLKTSLNNDNTTDLDKEDSGIDDDIAFKLEEQEENPSTLNDLLKATLKDFNFDIQEYDSIKEALGYDSSQMVDLVSKFIAIEKGESLSESVAYIAYKLLGKNNNKIIGELKYRINSWDKYKETFEKVKKEVYKEEGYIEDSDKWKNIVRDRVIIAYLKETIVDYYNNPTEFKKVTDRKWTQKDFTFFEKFIRAVKKLFTSKEKSKQILSNLSAQLANEILTREYDIYDFSLEENQVLKEYQNTIDSDPFAKEVVNFVQKLELVLTGSLALRRAGTVYRTEKETLHDLDFVVPYVNNVRDTEVYNKLITLQNKADSKLKKSSSIVEKQEILYNLSEETLEELQNFYWYRVFKAKYPSYTPLMGFYGVDHSNYESFTIGGVIDGKFYEKDTLVQTDKGPKLFKKGDHVEGTGYVIDFFIRLKPEQEEHENYFKLWKEIMIAKLKMNRAKDLVDFVNYVPYKKSKDTYNFYYPDWVFRSSKKSRLKENYNVGESVEFDTSNLPVNESKTTSVGLNWIYERLPDSIKINSLDTLKANLANNGITLGAFVNNAIYLKDFADLGTAAHESFHAVFRSLLTDDQITKYLNLARDARGIPTKEEINDLRNKVPAYANKSDRYVSDILLEEYLAEQFEKFVNKKKGRNGLLRNLFNYITKFINFITNNTNELNTLFTSIDNGHFKNSAVKRNRFSTAKDGVAFKVIPGLSSQQSSFIVNKIGGGLMKAFKDPNNTLNWARFSDLSIAVDREMDIYYSLYDKVNYSDFSTWTRDKKKDLIKLQQVYKSDTSRQLVKEELYKKFKRYASNASEELQEEIDINETSDRNYELLENEISAFDNMTKEAKQFIGFTTYESLDAFGNKIESSIDISTVYPLILRAVAGEKSENIFSVIKHLALEGNNKEVAALWTRIKKEIPTVDVPNAKHNSLYYRLLKAFEVERLNYLQSYRKKDGTVESFDASRKDSKFILFSRWKESYTNKSKKVDRNKSEVVKKLRYAGGLLKQESITDSQVKEIIGALGLIGIDLSEGYVKYSGNKDNTTKLKGVEKLSSKDLAKLIETVNKDQSPYKFNKGRITKIADNDAKFRQDLYEVSFQGADGKPRYGFVRRSHILVKTRELFDNFYNLFKTEYEKLNWFANDSNIRHILGNLKISHVGDIRIEGEEGVTLKNIDTQALIMNAHDLYNTQERVEKTEDGEVIKDDKGNPLTTSYFIPMILEAKNTLFAVRLPKENFVDSESNQKFGISENFINRIYNTVFVQEYKRLNKEFGTDFKTKVFTNLSFLNTPSFYKAIGAKLDKEGNVTSLPKLEELNSLVVRKAIRVGFENEIIDYLELLSEENLVTFTDIGWKDKGLKSGKRAGKPFKDYITNFVLNDFVNAIGYSQLIQGDLAITKGSVDRVKRNGGENASGNDLGEGEYKVIYTEEEIAYKEIDTGRDITEDVKSKKLDWNKIKYEKTEQGYPKYAEVNVDDAQTYATLGRHQFIKERLGRLNKTSYEAYKKLFAGEKLSPSEERAVDLISLKTVHYGEEHYHKMSVFAITREFTSYISSKDKATNKKLVEEYFNAANEVEALEKIREINALWKPRKGRKVLHNKRTYMENNGIDEAVPISASKIKSGKTVNNSVFSESYLETETRLAGYTPTSLLNKDYRLQQENNSGKTEIILPTQLLQLIHTELPTNPNDPNYEKFKNLQTSIDLNYTEAKKLSVDYATSIVNKLEDGKVDKRFILRRLRDLVETSSPDLQTLELLGEINRDLEYDLNIPHIKSKMERLFLSYFNKGVLSRKIAGNKLTLVSAKGFEIMYDTNTGEIFNEDTRQYFQEIEESPNKVYGLKNVATRKLRAHKLQDGKIEYAEVAMTKGKARSLGIDISDSQKDQIYEMIGTRIPTQTHHSMMPIKVVEFLPDYYGDVIIAPEEITYLSGADYDIDSLYVIRKEFYIDENKNPVIYGSARNIEESFDEFYNWHKEHNKELKLYVNELKTGSKEYQHKLKNYSIKKGYEEVVDLVDAILTGDKDLKEIKELEKGFYLEGLKELGLPNNVTEFENRPDLELTAAAYNNQLIENYKEILTSPELAESLFTPATMTTLSNAVNEIFEKRRGLEEGKNLHYGITGKLTAFHNNKVGKENVGPANNINVLKALLGKIGATLSEENQLMIDGKSYGDFSSIREDDYNFKTGEVENSTRRIADSLSTIVSTMTDNAKERIAAKLNLTVDTLNSYSLMVALGLGINRTMLIANQDIMLDFSKKIKENKSALSRDVVIQEKILKDLIKQYKRESRSYKILSNEVKPENISSKGSEFAKELTNLGNDLKVTLNVKDKGETTFRNAEHAYQTLKSGEFDQEAYDSTKYKPVGSKPANKKINYQIMVGILKAKLEQHPELVQGINERGGLSYIENSTHKVFGKDKFWESTGENKFIEALADAYTSVQPTQQVSEVKKDIQGFKDFVNNQKTEIVKESYSLNSKSLAENISNEKDDKKSRDDYYETNIAAAQLYLKTYNLYKNLRNVLENIKSNKGIDKSSFESLDKILDADKTLQEDSMINYNLLENDLSYTENVKSIEKVAKASKEYFIDRQDRFIEIVDYLKTLAPTIKDSQLHKFKRKLLTNLILINYRKFKKLNFSKYSTLLYPSLGGKTLVQSFRENANIPEFEKNLFIKLLTPETTTTKVTSGGVTKDVQVDVLAADSRVKYSADVNDALQDAFASLGTAYAPKEFNNFLYDAFRYLIAKDNIEYREGSFIKFANAPIFKELANSIKDLKKTLNETTTPVEDSQFYRNFLELYLRDGANSETLYRTELKDGLMKINKKQVLEDTYDGKYKDLVSFSPYRDSVKFPMFIRSVKGNVLKLVETINNDPNNFIGRYQVVKQIGDNKRSLYHLTLEENLQLDSRLTNTEVTQEQAISGDRDGKPVPVKENLQKASEEIQKAIKNETKEGKGLPTNPKIVKKVEKEVKEDPQAKNLCKIKGLIGKSSGTKPRATGNPNE